MFTTRTQREYKLLISGDESKTMEEYEGDVHMKGTDVCWEIISFSRCQATIIFNAIHLFPSSL